MKTKTMPEGWYFEDDDPSVGIFASFWIHDACPAYDPSGTELHEPTEAIEELGRDGDTVHLRLHLTCADCKAETHVDFDDWDPEDDDE